jgi:hypothetical protein
LGDDVEVEAAGVPVAAVVDDAVDADADLVAGDAVAAVARVADSLTWARE